MRKRWLLLTATVTTLLSGVVLGAQGEQPAGPRVGKDLPGAFQSFNLNGTKGKDKLHCLVCEYHLNPVVLTFVREGKEPDDAQITKYLEKVNEAVKDNERTKFLRGFVVFLTPYAASGATEAKIDPADIKDVEKRDKLSDRLIEEAQQYGKLVERLSKLASKLDKVVVTFMPAEGPKGYNLPPQPGVTVVLYHKLKVEQVYVFPEGKLDDAATAQVLKGIDAMLNPPVKKKKG